MFGAVHSFRDLLGTVSLQNELTINVYVTSSGNLNTTDGLRKGKELKIHWGVMKIMG